MKTISNRAMVSLGENENENDLPFRFGGIAAAPLFSPEVVHYCKSWSYRLEERTARFADSLHLQPSRRFPHLRLVLAGPPLDGDCARWIHDEISLRKLEGIVQMPGGLTDKTAFWQAADIYVQPSHFEGAPMALMEAALAGQTGDWHQSLRNSRNH